MANTIESESKQFSPNDDRLVAIALALAIYCREEGLACVVVIYLLILFIKACDYVSLNVAPLT